MLAAGATMRRQVASSNRAHMRWQYMRRTTGNGRRSRTAVYCNTESSRREEETRSRSGGLSGNEASNRPRALATDEATWAAPSPSLKASRAARGRLAGCDTNQSLLETCIRAYANNMNVNDNVAGNGTPTIRYSRATYGAGIATGLLVAILLLVFGVAYHQSVSAIEGLAVLLFVGVFALGVKHKLASRRVALAREGDLLVGSELKRPLPVSETTFEIVSDYEGGWGVVLRVRDETIALRAGGWKVEGERFVTKAIAERTLLALGLKQQAR